VRRLAVILVRIVASVALGLLLLGVPVLVLQAPIVTRTLVARYYDASDVGLPLPVALRTAEAVRAYTTDPSAPPLPAEVSGRSGFDAEAASHLRDVRGVLAGARVLTLVSAAVLALLLSFALPQRRYCDIAFVLRAGSLGTMALAVVAGVAGAIDFDAFFGFFHGLFFVAGTWEFPAGTLLIALFPEPLWAALGALWAAGVVLGVAVALVASWRVSHADRSHGSQVV
jgi:hypothetical protein